MTLLKPRRVLGYGIYITVVDTIDVPWPDERNPEFGRRTVIYPNIIGKFYNWTRRVYLAWWGDFSIPHNDKLEQQLSDSSLTYRVYEPKGSIIKQLVFQNRNMVEMKLTFGQDFESMLLTSSIYKSSRARWYNNVSIIKKPPSSQS